jgi:formamidopyrimidine-DNA glycosylase
MGIIQLALDDALNRSYVYNRDFNPAKLSPSEDTFTLDRFSSQLDSNNRMLKPVLVGKDAIVVGLSNSAFQDILYRAKLYPKRKASELTKDEKQILYQSILDMLQERIHLNGKTQFSDLYGKQGQYHPPMGPHMKQQACRICGSTIEQLSYGGGQVYYCPQCQK